MSRDILIYGASGYTAGLIVERAVADGARPILAGRTDAKLGPLAERFGLPTRVFALDDRDTLAAQLAGVAVVLNCAGPFSRTALELAAACLAAGAHYLDITGEIEVFEAMAELDGAAQAAGVMLMPGCGFDVVPSDCLAAHLKRRLPSATRLTLAFRAIGRPSHGTATT
ncbi:MAG: saccharopine dehydrogenase NADP-binding domain-containing protein, partial [Azonexus sp.]